MGHTPHELTEEFPDKLDRIRDLKENDAHFRKLSDDYHELNRAIHRAAENIQPTDQFTEENMRKERLHLKDKISKILD